MATKLCALAVPVAVPERVRVLPEMALMVSPAGRLGPLRVIPAASPAVLATVARVLPEVVFPPLKETVPPAVVYTMEAPGQMLTPVGTLIWLVPALKEMFWSTCAVG